MFGEFYAVATVPPARFERLETTAAVDRLAATSLTLRDRLDKE